MTPQQKFPLPCRRRAPVLVRLQESGFTLMELLVVVSIIAVLAALAVPAVSGALAKSNDAKCLGNLRQLYVGSRMYAADNDGMLPMETGAFHANVFPYLYPDVPTSEWGTNGALNRRRFGAFCCPSDPEPRAGKLSYGMNGLRKGEEAKFFAISSKAILIADSSTAIKDPMPYQLDNTCNLDVGTARHSGGKDNFVFLDGHVETIIWPKLSDPTNSVLWDPKP